jgi:hypothetical protein
METYTHDLHVQISYLKPSKKKLKKRKEKKEEEEEESFTYNP